MDESFEITMVRRPDKGAPLYSQINCDREMAAAWCRAMAEELEAPAPEPTIEPTRLRIGAHPMALHDLTEE